MAFTIYQTTAEEIIGATDAIVQKGIGASEQMIADFLATSVLNAQNAANMCVQLGLARQSGSDYYPSFPYSNYIVTSNPDQKAAILRFILEEYIPYKTFKVRLQLSLSPDAAASQIKAIFALAAHRTEITNTFISLGTFTNSIVTAGAGRYSPAMGNEYSFIKVVNEVVQNRQTAELKIRERLGEEICQWINPNDVLSPLVTAFQRLGEVPLDARVPILHSGNAFESFLVQVANHFGANLAGANGINAKIDRLTPNTATHLTTKHKNIVKYLGHIRNACDHGVDAEIGNTWTISSETSIEYVHVCLTTVRSIYDRIQGNFIL